MTTTATHETQGASSEALDALLDQLGVLESRQDLEERASHADFAPGQFVFREGGQADTLYLIERGRVVLERRVGGHAIEVETLGDGDILGWSWLVPPCRWHFDARVVEPTRTVAFDGRGLRRRCEEDHEVGYAVLQRFSQLIARRLERACARGADSLPAADVAVHGGGGFAALLGTSDAIREARLTITRAIPSHCPLLLQAETGVGAAQVARAIHYTGPRRAGPILEVDCGQLPECVQETELFGRSDPTSQASGGVGLLQLAAAGTLFLDGISHLSSASQARLLRHLDQVEREADSENGEERRLRARIIGASHRDLESEVETSAFSPQLFLRLGVLTARIPPLRHRAEDVPVLAQHFLSAYVQRSGRPVSGFAEGALELLSTYDWPGNVTELKRAVETAAARAGEGEPVRPQLLKARIREAGHVSGRCRDGEALTEALRRIKRGMIEEALAACAGNRTRAAQRLGMSRTNLQKTMQRLNIG